MNHVALRSTVVASPILEFAVLCHIITNNDSYLLAFDSLSSPSSSKIKWFDRKKMQISTLLGQYWTICDNLWQFVTICDIMWPLLLCKLFSFGCSGKTKKKNSFIFSHSLKFTFYLLPTVHKIALRHALSHVESQSLWKKRSSNSQAQFSNG